MSESASKFQETIIQSYTSIGDTILLGTAILDGEALPSTHITAPLKTFNRHGLIAGATGTGKTKTLQIIAERLSEKGVPCLVMDVKGDLSGIATAGLTNEKIEERQKKIGNEYKPQGSPVEFLSLSKEPGVKLRATVSEFGPILFSKILDLNDTQASLVTILFKYCDDHKYPLLDLKDMKKIINFASNEGKKELEVDYGKISESSLSIVLRKIVELESQGAEEFFGEPSFEVEDLIRVNAKGQGIISILRLTDIQDKPKLFSTFMLCLLAEVYASFPEAGDMDKPKLVIFIDEAHLIFQEASKALLNQIETIIKLIRSKGVGIFFCTQSPGDVPESVLGQLGMKVQHALRAFTAKDRKEIKLTAQNYPISEYYDTEEVLTSLGMGEALITVLNEKGSPTALAATLLVAPKSRMDVLTESEISTLIAKSDLVDDYARTIDRESAYEILNEKLMNLEAERAEDEDEKKSQKESTPRGRVKEEKSTFEKVTESTAGKLVIKEVTRGLLGVLGLKPTTRRRTTRKKTGFFF